MSGIVTPFYFRAFLWREFFQSGGEKPAFFDSVQEYGILVGSFDDFIDLSGFESNLEGTMIKGQQGWILRNQNVGTRLQAELVNRFCRRPAIDGDDGHITP